MFTYMTIYSALINSKYTPLSPVMLGPVLNLIQYWFNIS